MPMIWDSKRFGEKRDRRCPDLLGDSVLEERYESIGSIRLDSELMCLGQVRGTPSNRSHQDMNQGTEALSFKYTC